MVWGDQFSILMIVQFGEYLVDRFRSELLALAPRPHIPFYPATNTLKPLDLFSLVLLVLYYKFKLLPNCRLLNKKFLLLVFQVQFQVQDLVEICHQSISFVKSGPFALIFNL